MDIILKEIISDYLNHGTLDEYKDTVTLSVLINHMESLGWVLDYVEPNGYDYFVKFENNDEVIEFEVDIYYGRVKIIG